jgi:hypothetical protein|tara:strand:+ start:243 stop:443 length:201 start_codon:yes stop_codon:yes gene_type:complete
MNTVLINDITFYKSDDEGNPLLDEITGEIKVFRIKQGYRVKALEYLMEDFDEDILEEEKGGIYDNN